MPAQEQAVEEGRLALRKVEVVLGLFDRLGCGWNRRVGVGLHLHLETEKAVYRKFLWRQVVPLSRVDIFAMSAAKRSRQPGLMPGASAWLLRATPRSRLSRFTTGAREIQF